MSKKNPHWGTSVDAFLDEVSIREAAKAEAVTRVVAWQLGEEMKRQGMTKAECSATIWRRSPRQSGRTGRQVQCSTTGSIARSSSGLDSRL